jgi:hypothetical protein
VERHIFLTVFGFTLLAIAVAVMLPGRNPPDPVNLPWQIERTADGGSRVFGLTLGRSSLDDAEAQLQEPVEVQLFRPEEGAITVEGYMDNASISGLRAKLVFTVDVPPERIEGIFDRGVRIAKSSSGAHKVTLARDDLAAVKRLPISAITYLPRADLSEELVRARFGEPARRIAGSEAGAVHLLYPQLGLDVTVDPEQHEVLQYVRPDRFDQLVQPLDGR